MNTCLTHNQSYPQDGWCVYCGQPQTATATKVCDCIATSFDSAGRCSNCGGTVRIFLPSVVWTTHRDPGESVTIKTDSGNHTIWWRPESS